MCLNMSYHALSDYISTQVGLNYTVLPFKVHQSLFTIIQAINLTPSEA